MILKVCPRRLEPTRVEPLTGHHPKGRYLALPANIWLGLKPLPVTKTIAYNGTEINTALKGFKLP